MAAPQSTGDGHHRLLRRLESQVTTVPNPFENPVPWTNYEVFKTVFLGLTLFPLRLAVFIVSLSLQIALAGIATIGAPLEEDRGCLRHTQPLALWRRIVLIPIVVLNRVLLWALGFWHIRIVDKRKDRSVKPRILCVAPHTNMIDPNIVAWAFPPLPSAVSKKSVIDVPGMGWLAKAGQGIFVDRAIPDSRHACKDAIAARADPKWAGPPTMIFPEGTTTNGRVLIQFKLGPFCPGQPVLPVLLRYPHKHFDISWCGRNSSTPKLIFRMMTQFVNFAEVEVLEAYDPLPVEQEKPKLFAENVRALMARTLGRDTTEHSYDDVFLASHARTADWVADFQVEDIKEKYDVTFEQLKGWIGEFRQLDVDRKGRISYATFEKALRSGSLGPARSLESIERLFAFFDTDQNGAIEYRELVQCLALLSGKCSVVSRAKLAFLASDVAGRGSVKRSLLQQALSNSVGHTSPKGLASEDSSPVGQLIATAVGVDGEDEVSFTDFCAIVEREPEVLEGVLQLTRERLGLPDLGRMHGGKRKALASEPL